MQPLVWPPTRRVVELPVVPAVPAAPLVPGTTGATAPVPGAMVLALPVLAPASWITVCSRATVGTSVTIRAKATIMASSGP